MNVDKIKDLEFGDYCHAYNYRDKSPMDSFALGFLKAVEIVEGKFLFLLEGPGVPRRWFKHCEKVTADEGLALLKRPGLVMRVRFFPRDIGLFRNEDFDFPDRGKSVVNLVAKSKYDYKDFYDRKEMIEYLKSKGVRLDDPENPLRIEFRPEKYSLGDFVVRQWTLLGWMKEIV